MKATQGVTGGPNRAHASFRNPHDGVASGAYPDKPKIEFQGECSGLSEGVKGRRFWGREKGTIAGGSRGAGGPLPLGKLIVLSNREPNRRN